MNKTALVFIALLTTACSSSKPFNPKSFYPPDPWVKGYANPDDCLGGEQLAAKQFDLPTYPSKPYRTGRQGWVILRLDVDTAGLTQNVEIERSLPKGMFDRSARRAVEDWVFEPPKNGPMSACRVLLRYRLGTVSLGG